MSDARRQKMQAWLHEVLPLYKFIGLEIVALGDLVRCRAPMTRDNSNHFGAMHAGVLFTLAEATAGVAIGQHRDLGAMTLIALRVEIEYLHVAKGAVDGVVTADDAFANAIREGLQREPRHTFEVGVDLISADGVKLARAACTFQLRAKR